MQVKISTSDITLNLKCKRVQYSQYYNQATVTGITMLLNTLLASLTN